MTISAYDVCISLYHVTAEMRIIDCHHLNERLWIKVSAVCSVACVGNGCRRIIRHEYSFEAQTITGLYRSILFQWMATGRRKSVIEICREIRRIEIGRKIRQET